MAKKNIQTIDDYIRTFPENIQLILEKVRTTITKSAPNATEGISYDIPTFYLNGKYFVYFAGFKKHISVYPATTEAVEKAGLTDYKVSKGTLKFPLNEKIPYESISRFVKERLKEQK